jgi:hypothetical protein
VSFAVCRSVLLTLFLAQPSTVRAQTLDQSCETDFGSVLQVGPKEIAQTFTVGSAGLLMRMEIPVEGTPIGIGFVGDIRPTFDGVPVEDDGQAFASISSLPVPPGGLAWVPLDLSEFGIMVEVGDVLAVVARAPAGGWLACNTLYAGGSVFDRDPSISLAWSIAELPDVIDPDMAFRTFVPEPSTAALQLAAFAGVWLMRRSLSHPCLGSREAEGRPVLV